MKHWNNFRIMAVMIVFFSILLCSCEKQSSPDNAVLCEIEAEKYRDLVNLTEYELEDNVYKIGEYAFSGTGLKKLDASNHNNLKAIGCCAFATSKLKEVALPETLEIIGQKAFAGCSQLEHIRIDSMYVKIHPQAFVGAGAGCEELTIECYKGSTVDYYVNNNPCFTDNAVTSINIEYIGEKTSVDTESWDTYAAVSDKGELQFISWAPHSEIVIPESITGISYEYGCAFDGLEGTINSVVFPSGIKQIGSLGTTYIEKIFFGDNFETLSEGANLYVSEIYFKSNLKEIESMAINSFYLKQLTIESTDVHIAQDAINGISNSQNIIVKCYKGSTADKYFEGIENIEKIYMQ